MMITISDELSNDNFGGIDNFKNITLYKKYKIKYYIYIKGTGP